MAASDPPPRRDAHSPVAGCTIMIAAIVTLCFLVGFAIWNLFKQDSELAKFTETTARPVPVPGLVEHAAQVNVLTSKIETFRIERGHDREGSLKLTPAEINLGIAAYDEFKELRKTFSVRAIEEGKLTIDISFPLRGSPGKDDYRYLNGTMIATPRLSRGEIALEIERIETTEGSPVPEGFIGQLSPYRITQRYRDDDSLGPWMAKLTSLSLEDGAMVLVSTPGESSPGEEIAEIAPHHVIRALAFFGVAVLFVALVAIFAVRRGRVNRSE